MGQPGLWALLWRLLLLSISFVPHGSLLAEGCPSECQCNQAQMVFCISRKSRAVPQGLPPETTNLYLFENGIRSLGGESFAGLPALHLLDLSQNEIASLAPGLFRPLGSLRNLDLSFNHLHQVGNESFQGLPLLERLYLHHNQIRDIHPAAFDALGHLLELKLQDNRLEALPAIRLPALLLLDLSRNPLLSALEPGAFHTPRLESLKVAGLGLRSLEEGEALLPLWELANLHELDLSDNLLAQVPRALPRLHSLTKLSLAGNGQISRLRPEDFQGLAHLQELDISNLNLRSLPGGFFGPFPRLKALTAAENPFNCVCQLSWLQGWLSANKAALRRAKETRCHFPPKNAGKMLLHLEYADFGCPATTTVAATTRATSPKLGTAMVPSSGHGPPEPSTRGAAPGDSSSTTTTTATPVTPLQFPPRPGHYLCPPHTCLNGGRCQLDAQNHLECACPPSFTGLFCETRVPVMTAAAAASSTQAPTLPSQVLIKHIGGTSLKVDLQSYARSQGPLKGIRLTFRNLSGPDKRPVTLSLPASLPEYTVRALKPNSTYHICLGPLGAKAQEEDLCLEAQTRHATQQQQHQQQQHGKTHQDKDDNLTLVVAPALAAVLLLVAAAATISCYVRWRRKGQRQQQQQRKTAGPLPSPLPLGGVNGSGPLEVEGAKACLEKGDPTGATEKATAEGGPPHGLDYEVPLMQPPGPSSTTPRPPRASYF